MLKPPGRAKEVAAAILFWASDHNGDGEVTMRNVIAQAAAAIPVSLMTALPASADPVFFRQPHQLQR